MRFCNSTLLTRTRAGLFLSLLGTLRGRAGFEFVARIRRLACRDGWCRGTTPSVTLDPRCRSRPMLTLSPYPETAALEEQKRFGRFDGSTPWQQRLAGWQKSRFWLP